MKIIYYLIKIPLLNFFLPSLIRRFFILIKKEKFLIKFKNLILENNIKDPQDRDIFFYQEYDDKQFDHLFLLIKEYGLEIFLDIGANSGIYSLILSKKHENLNIHAFEPIKSNYEKFLKNVKHNKLEKNINIHNLGLSDQNKTLKMLTNSKFGYRQSAGYSVTKYEESKSKNENQSKTDYVEARFVKGDEFFDYKKKKLLIKIDTEGHEPFVLKGMSNLFKYNIIFLQIEIWKQNNNSINKILKSYNFTFIKKIKDDYFFIKENYN